MGSGIVLGLEGRRSLSLWCVLIFVVTVLTLLGRMTKNMSAEKAAPSPTKMPTRRELVPRFSGPPNKAAVATTTSSPKMQDMNERPLDT